MRFQVLSDLHLEFTTHEEFRIEKAPGADALILAGDLGSPESPSYQRLLAEASAQFQWVFVTLGNHEAYGHTLEKTARIVTEVCSQHANAHFLNRTTVDLGGGVRVAGCTLWSEIEEEQRSDVCAALTDFRLIKDWTFETSNAQHRNDVKFLEGEIARARADGVQLVVATHHAPHTRGTSAPQHRWSPLSSAFATDLSRLLAPPVVAWVFGHTHHSSRQEVGGVQLISNQRGYPRECTGFKPMACFDVPDGMVV